MSWLGVKLERARRQREAVEAFDAFKRGYAHNRKGEYDKAIADLTKAIRLDPKRWGTAAYFVRGRAYAEKGEYAKAIADFTEVIRLDPRHAVAYYSRGNTRCKASQYDEALADYSKMIWLAPDEADGHNALAWFLSSCPDPAYRDGKRAVASATKACELDGWKSDYMIGTLAAAYAEVGDFEKAVKWQQEAHSMYSEEEKQEWGFLLDLYKSGKRDHETPKE